MCTGIFIKTKNNKYIFARTLEFGIYLKWKQVCTAHLKGTMGNFQGTLNREWYMTDGVNKDGLFVGTFFFPHNDKQYSKKQQPDLINIKTGYVNEFLLTNCKNVDGVVKIAENLNILETKLGNELFSLHWIVCDKSGKCIVLEVSNKKLKVYANPYRVITNSPGFLVHEKNVQKYDFLSKYNKPNSMSQGTGAIGLPGDSTSESRFVRANFYVKNMPEPENSRIGMESALRILHNFDIPLGSVEERKTGQKEVTEYTVVYNINDKKMKYAPYGYIMDKNNEWKQTESPVKLC